MKVVLKIERDENFLKFQFPNEIFRQKIKTILEKCESKYNGYCSLNIEVPYKPRTTGENSQNNLFWWLVTQIAKEVGDDSDGMIDTENGIKERALSRGYPYKINPISKKMIPLSMTKINTVQCSILIETAYQIVAELGIVLPPTPFF